MAIRKIVFANGEIYHLYNRSVASEQIFIKDRENNHFLSQINYYRYKTPLRYTHYQNLSIKLRKDYLRNQQKSSPLVDIYAFSLMPNHFHLLAKQVQDGGIQKFMSITQNSYAKYYNTKNKRYGSVFQNPFKATRIESDEQFMHVVRYIHLNPVTGYLIKPGELANYPWTSFSHYVGGLKRIFITRDLVFSELTSIDKLMTFTMDNVDYQRKLAYIKNHQFDKI